ncbi:MAG: invasin domain 3-containing protein [Planctomycetota bacterium]|jgi:hypothetical protein
MTTGRRILSAAVALSFLGALLPAYVVNRESDGTEIRWNTASGAANVVGGKVTYYVNSSETTDLTAQQVEAAVAAGVNAWSDAPGTDLEFLHDTSRQANGQNAGDRINTVFFESGNLEPFRFAVTYTLTKNRLIVDSDIEINDDKTWSVTTPGTPGRPDLQSIIAHEWGHAIGLDHVPQANATMFFAADDGSVQLRSLTPDDEAAVGHLYPNNDFTTVLGSIAGTIDIGEASDDRGAQVMVMDLLTGEPAGGDFTETDGSYVVDGLPEGIYFVFVVPIGTTKIDAFVYNSYWNDANTAFLPGIHREQDGATAVVVVDAGQSVTGIDIDVADTASPHEPNNTLEQAADIDLGESLSGRFENSSDIDVFAFQGTAGQSVSLYVHAKQMGSAADPRIILRNAAGTTIASNDDISLSFFDEPGVDSDARILDFELPSTEEYFIQIEAEQSVLTDFTEDFFYVLTVLPGGGSASPLTSELTVTPEMVDADGSTTMAVVLTPRSLTGQLVGPEQNVTMSLSPGNGSIGGVSDLGDGTYRAFVTADFSPGSDTVTARVDGVQVASGTTVYLGPAVFANSTLVADPRRIPSDGTSMTTLTFTPRDVNDYSLGSNRTVVVTDEGGDEGTLSGVTNEGDGTYTFTLTAGTESSTINLPMTVNGVAVNGFTFELGYPVEDIIDDVLADLGEMLAGSPPAKSVKKLVKAQTFLDQIDSSTFPADGDLMLKTIAKALKQLEAAAKKGADVATQIDELTQAAREAASDAIDDAEERVDDPKEEKRLAKAQALLGKGDLALVKKASKAVAKYRGAFKQTLKIQ